REKLTSSEERRRRAERAKGDVQRALTAAIDANRIAEAEVVPLERELEAARRRDEVAAEMDRQARQEELADSFFRRRRRQSRGPRRCSCRPPTRPESRRQRGSTTPPGDRGGFFVAAVGARDRGGSTGEQDGRGVDGRGDFGDAPAADGEARSAESDNINDTDGRGGGGGGGGGDHGAENGRPPRCYHCRNTSHSTTTTTSPLLLPTLSRGFHALSEACRRSQGMRRLAAARRVRAQAERRHVMKEALAAWALGAALERGERGARERRAVEAAQLC
ncbi:unnamed protein product, partial [Hapterophycus canaliculatus]